VTDITDNYMVCTSDRLSISELLYPTVISNRISILSSEVQLVGELTLLDTFSTTLWIASALIADEQEINYIMALNPSLPLHKSTKNTLLAISGLLVRKDLNPWVKQRFKQKFTVMVETGLLMWRIKVNKIIAKTKSILSELKANYYIYQGYLKSVENTLLAISGLLVRKDLNPWIKQRFKQKRVYCTGE
ncbi:unnamed protein product, partial [Medioppia subpectinata]